MYFLATCGTTLAGGSARGQTQRPLDRRAMGQDRTAPPTTPVEPPWWPALGPPSCRARRHPVGAQDGSALVRPAERISESLDVLAAAQTLGRGRDVGTRLACLPDGARRGRQARVGDGVHRWHLCPDEKGGSDIGPTKRGKGTKCMVLVERQGLPLGIRLASASPAEVTLIDQTLAARVTPHRRKPHRLVRDRGYDSDPLREHLATCGITLISPYHDNRTHRPYEDRRRPRTGCIISAAR